MNLAQLSMLGMNMGGGGIRRQPQRSMGYGQGLGGQAGLMDRGGMQPVVSGAFGGMDRGMPAPSFGAPTPPPMQNMREPIPTPQGSPAGGAGGGVPQPLVDLLNSMQQRGAMNPRGVMGQPGFRPSQPMPDQTRGVMGRPGFRGINGAM